jgi:energy-coupling factor transporter ATP-binding protein EcfA2
MYPVHIKDLSFTYRGAERKALDGIDLDLHEGEMVVLMGRTGAGKSTLCRCLNGIIPNFQKGRLSGDVRIFGESTKDKRIYELAQNVGLVFQDFEPQLFSTSVELEVAFGPENLALPREEIAERVKYALRTVGLEGFENRQPYNLSGGEKQRLAIASILSSKPKILVLDEPTTDLDPQGRHDILSALKKLREESISLLVVEQDAEDVIDADRIVVMDAGRIVASGEPRETFADVHFLERHGIRPPQVAKLFRELKGESEEARERGGEYLLPHPLDCSMLPLTAQEAYDLGSRLKSGLALGASLDEEEFRLLQWEDEKRKDKYGNIIIDVRGLKHSYPAVPNVLTGIDLQIRDGEFVAIIGQNGSGKTTLVKHFNGLLRPSEGSVLVKAGRDEPGPYRDTGEMNISELGRIVGYVFQNPDHQIFASNVRDEVTFGPKNYDLSQEEISTNVDEALEAVHLKGYEENDPFSLTKGERQRVAVASVLACKPRVLVLDEPTTGLDYSQQRSMMALLRSLNAAGHTIIIITHALWVVAEYAHRAIVMHDGAIMMDGTVREVFSQQDRLESVGMKLPEIVKLGNMLGKTLLSVDEYRRVIKE